MAGRRRSHGATRRRVLTVLLLVPLLVATGATVMSTRPARPEPWHPGFAERGLVTNEWAYRNREDARAHLSSDWWVTSGSLFADQGTGTGGAVDGGSPGPDSREHTGSAVFRAVSRRRDFADVRYTVELRVDRFGTTGRTGSRAFDGLHLFLRYHDHDDLYAVSVCRRDGQVVMKRKARTPGGDAHYTTLAAAPGSCAAGRWYRFGVSCRNTPAGVRLVLHRGHRRLLTTTDDGSAGIAPLTSPGAVGLRADNVDFRIRNVSAVPLLP